MLRSSVRFWVRMWDGGDKVVQQTSSSPCSPSPPHESRNRATLRDNFAKTDAPNGLLHRPNGLTAVSLRYREPTLSLKSVRLYKLASTPASNPLDASSSALDVSEDSTGASLVTGAGSLVCPEDAGSSEVTSAPEEMGSLDGSDVALEDDELVEVVVVVVVVLVEDELDVDELADVVVVVVVVVVDDDDVFDVGLTFVVVVVGSTIIVAAASCSSASARSQALVSFSQPTNGAVNIAKKTMETAALGLDDPPGLRWGLACRGSLVFVIVSRYPACAAITTSMRIRTRPRATHRNPRQRRDTRFRTSFRRSRTRVRRGRCTPRGAARTPTSCSSLRSLAPPRRRSTHVGRRWAQRFRRTLSRRFAHTRALRRSSQRGKDNTLIGRSHRHTIWRR